MGRHEICIIRYVRPGTKNIRRLRLRLRHRHRRRLGPYVNQRAAELIREIIWMLKMRLLSAPVYIFALKIPKNSRIFRRFRYSLSALG